MEKRSEARIEHNIRFFVHVHAADREPDMIGMSLQCDAIDFSAHGMQFSTNAELSAGALINITIGIGEPFAMYLLRGEVRWMRQGEDDLYLMGVLLQYTEDTDLDKWIADFEENFPAG